MPDKVSIESVYIPTFGWNLSLDNEESKQWINIQHATALSINYFETPPDLITLKDIDTLRNHYRNVVASNGGGIIEVEFISIHGIQAVKTIFKFPQEPNGMTYLGSLTIPFKNYSFVIKVHAYENGTIGLRDSTIAAKLLNENIIQESEDGFEGWYEDPYQKNYQEGTLMNKSELEKYDIVFPDHPLSITRNTLTILTKQTRFGSEIYDLEKFNL